MSDRTSAEGPPAEPVGSAPRRRPRGPRRPRLIAAAIGFAVGLALLTWSVEVGWTGLVGLDGLGADAAAWADRTGWPLPALLAVEDAFGTWPMTVYTVVLAVAMLVKSHRRAAILVVLVMAVTAGATTGMKLLLARDRPEWQSLEQVLESFAFPSGHTSSVAALAGLMVVLVQMLVRRGAVRRLLVAMLLLVVVVVALDRILLGRHFPTDVLGGGLLAGVVLCAGLAIYSPLPRSHAARAEPLPEVVPSQRRLAVVLNPIKVEDVGVFQGIVTAMAAASGWSRPTWHFTTPEDSGTGQAEQAAVEGADLVIVCGGDGTVREVCAELAGTGIPVGIVPAGTGNLLARNLDLPLYMRAAIDIALTGQDRAIDLVKVRGDAPYGPPDSLEDGATEAVEGEGGGEAEAEGEPRGSFESHFLVMAGMGFDAAIMEGVNEDIKKRVGWLAYVVSALKSLMYPVVKVEVRIAGGAWVRHRARTIVVGNVGYLQAGMPLLPDAAVDDGRLDLVLLYPRRFLSWIPLAVRVLAKRRRTDETVNRMTGRTIAIRASADTPRQLDGDSIGPGRELSMECVHGRLLVRVPR